MKHINVYNTKFIPTIIIACCVLHNICMLQKDYINVDMENVQNTDNCESHDANAGVRKRNYIADLLM